MCKADDHFTSKHSQQHDANLQYSVRNSLEQACSTTPKDLMQVLASISTLLWTLALQYTSSIAMPLHNTNDNDSKAMTSREIWNAYPKHGIHAEVGREKRVHDELFVDCHKFNTSSTCTRTLTPDSHMKFDIKNAVINAALMGYSRKCYITRKRIGCCQHGCSLCRFQVAQWLDCAGIRPAEPLLLTQQHNNMKQVLQALETRALSLSPSEHRAHTLLLL